MLGFGAVEMPKNEDRSDLAVKILERAWAGDPASLVGGLSSSNITDYLSWMVATVQENANVEYGFVGQLSGEDLDRVKTLAVHASRGPLDNFEYDLKGTPCANVAKQSICSYAAEVTKHFPDDRLLVDMKAESYMGIPLSDGVGRPLGIAVLLHTKPMDEDHLLRAQALLEFFRPRTEAALVTIRDAREREILLDQAIEPGEDALGELTKFLARALHVRVAFAAVPVSEGSNIARTLGLVIDGSVQEDMVYDMHETPCEHVYRNRIACVTENVAALYPNDHFLESISASGYAAIAFHDSKGSPIGHLGVIHDRPLDARLVDEPIFQVFAKRIAAELARHRADEFRLEAERALQSRQRTESLGILAGGIAHDFNNLLLSIAGNTELSLLDLSETKQVKSQLGEVMVAVDRAAELCRQMLAYAGRATLETTIVHLNRLAREMAQLLQVSLSKKVSLEYNLSAGDPTVEADAAQLQQVVMNLITNAADAIGDQPGTITITTGIDRAKSADAMATVGTQAAEVTFLRVEDTGCGMDAETQSKIFDPFFSTKEAGHGLGLAALQGIIRSHGGRIEVESEPGRGTNFLICFPMIASTSDPKHDDLATETPAPVTILVADDEIQVLKVTRTFLEQAGFETLTAMDGEEAIRVFKANRARIRCAVLDMSMPKFSGGEVLQELRALSPALPVILSSGFAEQEIMKNIASMNAVVTLHKPYRMASLVEQINELLKADSATIG